MALTPILNENLTAQVNGTNKVFTLANSGVNGVSQVNFDGAEYFDFSITGTNQITLVDAPQSYLYVDYYIGAGALPVVGGDFMTVQDMRDLLERGQLDTLPDLTDATFLDFVNWFNQESYTYLYKTNVEDFITEQTINTVVDQNNYPISSSVESMKVLGAGVFEENQTCSLLETGFNSTVKGYYKKGNEIILTPTPTSVETLTLRYIPTIGQLSLQSDETVLDVKYSQYVKDVVNISFYEWSRDPREVGSSQRVQSSFRQFTSRIQTQPNVYIV